MRKAMAVLLLALLLVGPAPPAGASHQPRLVWIPLDSRPVNTDEVSLFAEAGGMQVLLPPRERLDWYASRRSDFTGLLQWLRANSRRGDIQVIATNNLLTGGLIASRDAGLYVDLDGRLEALREALSELPSGRRIAVHALPRILPTQFRPDGSPDPDVAWRDHMVERSQLIHRVARLGAPQDTARLQELEALIPAPVRNRYDQLIEHNRKIASALLEWTRTGLLAYTVIGLDDGATWGMANLLQEEVQARAEALGIADRVFRHLGADEIGFLVVAREALQLAGVKPAIAVQYDQLRAPDLALPYEGGALRDSVGQKLAFLGAKVAPAAPQQLFLHTTAAPQVRAHTIGQIVQARSQGHSVTVVDVTSPGARDGHFWLELRKAVSPGGLNYAGWNTASNALGTGLAMAALSELHRTRDAGPDRALALERFRALRIGYDLGFQSRRADLDRWAVQHGIDPHRFEPDRSAMERHLQGAVLPPVQGAIADAVRQSLVDVNGLAYRVCAGRPDLAFRWDRTFEVQVQPSLALSAPSRGRCGR